MKSTVVLASLLSLAIASQAEFQRIPLFKARTNDVHSSLYGQNSQSYLGRRPPHNHGVSVDNSLGQQPVYAAEISLGSPPQPFLVRISTGTSQFWVPSSYCLTQACRQHARFQSSASTTFKSQRTLFWIQSPQRQYSNDDHGNITTSDCGNSSSSRLTTQSTGDLLGIVGSDRLALTEGVVVKNPPQAFGEIVDERHGGLRDALWEQKDRAITAGTTSHADGVLGLGYDPDAVTGRPLLLNLQDQHTLKENVFGVYLSRGDTDTGVDHVDHPHRPESELTLGGLDPNHRQAEIQWHEVTRVATGQWAIELTAFALKREAFEIDGNAVIDTGFPYIALTRYQAESINAQIGGVETEKGSGVYEVPCQNVPEFFEFILLFGQEEYQLKGNEYIVQKRTTRQEGGAKRGKASDHQDVCQSAIIGMDFSKESGVVAIFGEVFLKKYYSAYDLDHHRLGFALAT